MVWDRILKNPWKVDSWEALCYSYFSFCSDSFIFKLSKTFQYSSKIVLLFLFDQLSRFLFNISIHSIFHPFRAFDNLFWLSKPVKHFEGLEKFSSFLLNQPGCFSFFLFHFIAALILSSFLKIDFYFIFQAF